MRNIALVVDSTTLISEELENNPHVYVAPLSVIVDDKEYKDEVDIFEEDWINFLKADSTMTTSQPDTNVMIEILNEVKSKNYDFVYLLSLTSNLSGTLNSFNIGIEMTELENYELIDTFTIAGAVGYVAEQIWNLNQQGMSHDQIMEAIKTPLHNNSVLIWPGTLQRLIKSGRLSKTAGTLGSLLKLNVLLVFGHHMSAIEKHEIIRSERKVANTFIKWLEDNGVNEQDYVLYLLNVESSERIEIIENKIRESFGDIEIRYNQLPGVIATHVGIGTMGVQYVKKAKNL